MKMRYTKHGVLRLSDFKAGRQAYGIGWSEPKECIELCLNCGKPKCRPNDCKEYMQLKKKLKSEVTK